LKTHNCKQETVVANRMDILAMLALSDWEFDTHDTNFSVAGDKLTDTTRSL
jgi:hypothetical protein